MATARIRGEPSFPNAAFQTTFEAALISQIEARSVPSYTLGFFWNILCSDRTEGDTLMEWIRTWLGQTGGLAGTISFHYCSHAAGESSADWKNCKDDAASNYQEYTS